MTDTKCKTPVGRLAWPNLFEPRLNDLNGKMEYSMQLIIPKDAEGLDLMKAAAAAAAQKRWGDDLPKNLRTPFRDGDDEKEGLADYKGCFFLNMKSNQRPGIVDQNVQPVMDPSEILPGDFVRASVNAYAYSQKGNNGVAFGLNNVQYVRKGEPLMGARARAEDDFDVVGEGAGDGLSAEEAKKIADSIF